MKTKTSLPLAFFVISLLAVTNIAGQGMETRLFLPLLTRPACAPALISPEEGAVMDNADDGSIVWDFQWAECPGASSYHLYVIGRTAIFPLVDVTIANLSYQFVGSGYIAEQNRRGWTWKAQALTDGVWGPYSEVRSFDVEPWP